MSITRIRLPYSSLCGRPVTDLLAVEYVRRGQWAERVFGKEGQVAYLIPLGSYSRCIRDWEDAFPDQPLTYSDSLAFYNQAAVVRTTATSTRVEWFKYRSLAERYISDLWKQWKEE